MGFDNDCILNIQSLAGEYFCPVCHLLVYPNEALQAPCTHLYCKPCLTYVVSTTHACPYDGYRVVEADSKPLLESNKALADTIGKIQVHCLYYRTGCTWQGPLSDCTSHCSTCAYGESPVLCNRCGIQIVHRQVQEHAQNCPGVQSQTQQPSGAQDAPSTGAGAASDQSQTATQTGAPASQAQTSQPSAVPAPGQDVNQPANSATQPQGAQAAMPTPEQWYQQQQQYQQQYQQYYQQFPGYDPYQQQYPYYYQHPQGAQQYQQQPMQAYPPQAYGQAQTQPQPQPQQQVQPYAQPHLPQQPQPTTQAAHPQPQPQAQPAVNTQPQAQSVGQAQSQLQAQSQTPPSHALPHNQSQPLPQAQPYAQPQPVPQQQMQVPQYQQTHPQMQHPYPQPYPQPQSQHYPQPQTQAQLQAQPNPQASAHPPSQPNQPINPNAQLQAQNAVTVYQSYPQPQLHPQAQAGPGYPMHSTGAQVQQQPPFPGQMQGQFPLQPSQTRPPQPFATVPNQQQPAISQPPSGPPAQQLPAYPHTHQPGYPYQQRPIVQATQQAAYQQYGQQQSFPGQGPNMQLQPSMQGQLPAHGPSQTQQQPQQSYAPPHGAHPNAAQNYAGRQMAPQGAGSQPYAQAAGPAGAGQVRPMQLNQTYPMRSNNQLPVSDQQAVHPQKSIKTAGVENTRDQMLEKGVQDQNDPNKDARDVPGASGVGGQVDDMKKVKSESGLEEGTVGNDSKRDLSLSSAHELSGQKQMLGSESKVVENGVQEGKLSEGTLEGITDPSLDSKAAKSGFEGHKDVRDKAEVQDLKHSDKGVVGASVSAPMLPQSHLIPQVHGSNAFPSAEQGRNQPHPMHYGPTGQQRPGMSSMLHSMPSAGNAQQAALLGHPPSQLRPQGPGQALPRPPFNAADNSQSSVLNHPAGAIPHEHPSGVVLGSGLSGPFSRPGNVGHHPGHAPPYQAGQQLNPQGEPFPGPSFAAQRPGPFDSHGGIAGREPLHRPDMVEQRPPYSMDIEKFPSQRPGYFDGRQRDSHPHGSMERGPFGPPPPGVQPGAMKFSGPLAHDSMSAHGMRDERFKGFPEEHAKPFLHREFEDDLRKFPRPSHLEAGPSSKFGSQFPTSGPLDQDPRMFRGDNISRPFEKGPHGFDRDSGMKMDLGAGSGPSRFLPPFHPNDVGERGRAAGFPDDNMGITDFGRHPDFRGPTSGPGFGRHRMDGLPPRSPGRDYASFPSRPFGAFREIDGNELRPFEGSKPYNYPAETFRKSIHESRFPVPPNHLHRGELDVPGNMHLGDHLVTGLHNQDMLPSHLRRGEHMGPRNLHLGEGTAFGPSGGRSRMGEPSLAGNLPPHLPFDESFGGEKLGHPFGGEPAFRNSYAFQRYGRDGGFHPGDVEPFDNMRKRKPGSIMCRICKVECGTVEGLDLHSQSREHQRKAMDMVLSIKQQNKKKQKTSKDQASVEGRDGSKPKNSSFEGRGNRR